jgi:hypothetical protein
MIFFFDRIGLRFLFDLDWVTFDQLPRRLVSDRIIAPGPRTSQIHTITSNRDLSSVDVDLWKRVGGSGPLY